MAACQKVIVVFELVEAIVLQTEWFQIVACKRVNKRWKEIIEGSSVIREALFLDSTVGSHLRWWLKPGCPERCSITIRPNESKFVKPKWPRPVLNPLAYRFMKLERAQRFATAMFEVRHVTTARTPDSNMRSFYSIEAPWRSMLLTYPPTVSLNMECTGDVRWDVCNGGSGVRIENASGITVGDLVYAVCLHWCGCRDCPMSKVFGKGFIRIGGKDATGNDYRKPHISSTSTSSY